ncbi:MAG: hypothetical protein RLZZ290_843 [Pseudomonadota bacterium]|jgi:hypothetical protein
MIGSAEFSPLTEAIQLAVAPVFLLTGVAGMLNALGTRLARVIDRARHLQSISERLEAGNLQKRAQIDDELRSLQVRGRVINWATALMVVCAVLIGLTVMELFYSAGMAGRLQLSKWVSVTFLGGFGAFITACLLYLAEILIASQSVRIGR